MYSLTAEGVEIYEKLKSMLQIDIFPGDHESFGQIKKNHLYFLKQQHETTDDTEKFYSVREVMILSILINKRFIDLFVMKNNF